MKKKILSFLITILAVCMCMFTLTACGDKEPPHTHTYDQQVVNDTFKATNATCEDKATYYYSCTCGEKGTETFESGEALGHEYGVWISNGDGTHSRTCANCNEHEITETCVDAIATCTNFNACCETCGYNYMQNHEYENEHCKWCNASEGIAYTLSDNSYSVSGIGTCNHTDIVIPSTYNGKPVTVISSFAFQNTKITSIVIPDSVTSIDNYAFEDCYSLTSVDYAGTIDNWVQIEFGTETTNPLYYAENLYINGELVIEAKLTMATSIGEYAFSGCKSLISIVIPDSVTSIGSSAFYYCSSLTSVVIGDSVTSIGAWAFYYCSSLTSVIIGDSVTSIANFAFSNCTSLTSVDYAGTIDNWVQIEFGTEMTNPLHYAENLYINGELVTEAKLTMATSIGDRAFSGYSSLRSVVIGDSVTSIGWHAFSSCTSLTSVVIGDSVTSIGSSAFEYCESLTSVEIPDSVTSIGWYAFRGCTSLTSVVIGDSVTSIGSYAFYGCNSLTSLVIGDSVTSIDEGAFSCCYKLTSIKYRGTTSQWQAITKGSIWDYNTGNYTITYNYKGL